MDGLIYKKGNKYVMERDINDNFKEILKRHSNANKDMKNTIKGLKYVDNQCYFALKKNK
ncbi:MAG: hypothetical protein GX892_03835 [Thermoanaerobacteraceae bacterium]|nr:hypothetical protein [Thermoanaerobacteraceae bacterium]